MDGLVEVDLPVVIYLTENREFFRSPVAEVARAPRRVEVRAAKGPVVLAKVADWTYHGMGLDVPTPAAKRLGDRVTLGGQVGIGHQIEVGSDVQIGGQSGVTRNLPGGKDYFGCPALEARESFRIAGALRKLPELLRRVARLESGLSGSNREQE